MEIDLTQISAQDWELMILGALVSIAIGGILSWLYRTVKRRAVGSKRYGILRATRRGELVKLHTVTTAETLANGTRIGSSFEFPWVTVAYGPFAESDIDARYTAKSGTYYPEVNRWYDDLVQDPEHAGAGLFNSPGLRLVNFEKANRDGMRLVGFDENVRTGVEERAVLRLRFIKTDFFRNLTSDQRLDFPFGKPNGVVTTLRNEYLGNSDLRVRPYEGTASHFGVQLAVVTSDERLIVPKRGGKTAVSANMFAPSVAEGALPSQDVELVGNAYLPRLTAKRGLDEELGVTDPPDIMWLSFGANYLTGQYGLVGMLHANETFDELKTSHELALPKDKWENSKLFGVAFSPEAFADFVRGEATTKWSPFALVAFTHALVQSFGISRVTKALGDLRVVCG